MKSKKLFAILTLVAFMMTLLPAFAFADEPVEYSTSATTVKVNDKTIDVYKKGKSKIDDMAKFTITFKDSSNEIVECTGNEVVKFYLKTENYDALVGFVTNKDVDSWPKDDELEGLKIEGKKASSDAGQDFTIQPKRMVKRLFT